MGACWSLPWPSPQTQLTPESHPSVSAARPAPARGQLSHTALLPTEIPSRSPCLPHPNPADTQRPESSPEKQALGDVTVSQVHTGAE